MLDYHATNFRLSISSTTTIAAASTTNVLLDASSTREALEGHTEHQLDRCATRHDASITKNLNSYQLKHALSCYGRSCEHLAMQDVLCVNRDAHGRFWTYTRSDNHEVDLTSSVSRGRYRCAESIMQGYQDGHVRAFAMKSSVQSVHVNN